MPSPVQMTCDWIAIKSIGNPERAIFLVLSNTQSKQESKDGRLLDLVSLEMGNVVFDVFTPVRT